MSYSLAPLAVCALALPVFAYVQLSRRDRGLLGWTGFWALLLARQLVLASGPSAGSWTLAMAGICAVLAAAMLLFSARCLAAQKVAQSQSSALTPRWRYAAWAVTALGVVAAFAPGPGPRIAAVAAAVLLAAVLGLLWWMGAWPYRLLGLAAAVWAVLLVPGFPLNGRLAALAPILFSWAMLWLICHRAAAPAGAPGPEQLQLYRQSVRRSREFEILTHIGTALSSSLQADALLQTIHAQLQTLMDVRCFYVALDEPEHDLMRFAFEVENGQRRPPRSRPRTNALTEHVIASGQPLLISHDLNGFLSSHGLAFSGSPAKTWMGVPMLVQGQPRGVIAVQSNEREDVFDTEHLHVLEILAGQAGVALDNARLFAEVQRDAAQKSFLSHVARLTISTLSPAEMLSTVVAEVARTFHYDHIAVALVSPAIAAEDPPELEVCAVTGSHAHALHAHARIPVGQQLAGRSAASGEVQVCSGCAPAAGSAPAGSVRCLCPEAHSGLALPIRYAGQTLGVLALESHAADGFPPDQVLVLQTLTDQIAVALNHATLFQQMQHQAITDSLTGVKSRRFFMEALQAEWRRARAAQAGAVDEETCFAIVLVDLDEFKPLNDRFGHLEGDRILARVARVLEQKSRASSVVARYGGDEFTILVPACPPETARLLPQRLRDALEDDPLLAQRHLHASFGLATYPDSGATPEELLHSADADMYRHKPSRLMRVTAHPMAG